MKNFLVGLFVGVAGCLILHFWVFSPSVVSEQPQAQEARAGQVYGGQRITITAVIEDSGSMDPEIKNAIFDFCSHAQLAINEAVLLSEKIGETIPIEILHFWMERNTEEALKWEMRLKGKPPYPIVKD